MKLENDADPHRGGGDTGVPKVKLGLVLAVLARVTTARVASGLPRLLDGFLICSHSRVSLVNLTAHGSGPLSTYGLLILDLLLKEGLLVRHVALLRVVCAGLKSLRLGQRLGWANLLFGWLPWA